MAPMIEVDSPAERTLIALAEHSRIDPDVHRVGCPDCEGRGWIDDRQGYHTRPSDRVTCERCRGSRQVDERVSDWGDRVLGPVESLALLRLAITALVATWEAEIGEPSAAVRRIVNETVSCYRK